ncbi:hypothetical protein [Novipirellula artificiosorum]|uniref:Uncharacterized protein n=1 Tax=Novipirellula artificiosorum TaxID=2528016 RepID=A0A5C6DX34_9BACT|nr:hypothetical protein [Novipirellula artificiosorum]TWU41993.1 hypothetical protein Poly41_02890 [Novipirellula artificiosorum]
MSAVASASSPGQTTSPLRVVLSLVVIFHLLAVVVPPLSFQANGRLGRSPSVESLMNLVRGYAQFLYLDRGYAFFAPDPGPSHLIQAAISDAQGNMTETIIPRLEDQWPRLRYHRHFMLAEFLHEIYQPPGPPAELAEISPIEARLWEQSRSRYEHVRRSIVQHLESENPGQRVVIRRLEHVLPGFVEMANDPIELSDPRLYRVLADQSLLSGETNEATGMLPEAIPAPRNLEPDPPAKPNDTQPAPTNSNSDLLESSLQGER